MQPSGEFWKDYLASASQSLDLVLDKTRTSASTTAPRHLVFLKGGLPAEVTAAAAPGTWLLAAFHAYVARISSQEMVTLGVQPALLLGPAGVADDGAQPLVPLSCPAVGPDSTLSSHADQLQQLLRVLLPHSHLSLSDVCAAAGIEPASSMQHAVFQAGVIVAATPTAAVAAAAGLDLALVLLPAKDGSWQAALLHNSGLYTQEGAAMTAKHFEVFLAAAAAAAGDAGSAPTPLLAAPLMDASERQLVLHGFNKTDTAYDTSSFVHTQFAARARKTPHAPCVVYEDAVFSYSEIDAASNRIANYLISQAGVKPDDIVGVLVLRSPVMVATLLGVMKAGAGYLPLDHHHPEGRIEFMLQDASVKAVIVQPDLQGKLPAADALAAAGMHTLLVHPATPFLPADKPVRPAAKTAAGFPAVAAARLDLASLGAAASESAAWSHGQLGHGDSCCYIIYTSGSTGQPKGVVVLHKGLTAYVAWFRSFFRITAEDVFLQKTPTNFDASVDELYPSLTSGAPLVVAPPEAHRDVYSVMQLMTRHGVTTSSAVPSQLQILAREILAAHSAEEIAARRAPCASLKRVLSGGEALTTTMAADIKAGLPLGTGKPGEGLFNTCGPTEVTVGITAWLYEPPAPDTSGGPPPAAATVPIGRGIDNSRLYVLDASLAPVPVGVPGELYLSGIQVARGYLNREELNAKTFVPNPYAEGPATQRMYRTGDLVRWLPGAHACLEFLGRVDHQVKLRGFRIELQEVEAAIGALPGVVQVATALAKNPATSQDQLVAWVSPEGLEAQGMAQQLQGSLPEYMIPTVWVPMDQLPLLPSEKVNRKALPAPDFVRHAVRPPAKAAAPAAAPAAGKPREVQVASKGGSSCTTGSGSSSPMAPSPVASASSSSSFADTLQQYVGEVWAEVLGVDAAALAADSDFFALGGSSLLAGRMNAKLRSGLSIASMSGMLIYQSPSLGEFVHAVGGAGAVLPDGYGSNHNSDSSIGAASDDMDTDTVSSIMPVGHNSSGQLQQFITDTWAEVLGVDAASLDADSDFFALGGSSLLAGRMNAKLRSGLSVASMSGMLIYSNTTLAAFTEAVAKAGPTLPGGLAGGAAGAGGGLARQESLGTASSVSSFRIQAGTMRYSSLSSMGSGASSCSSSGPGGKAARMSMPASGGAAVAAEAAAQAAMAAYIQEQSVAAAGASWALPAHLAEPVAAATKAAYMAASAAYSTVLASLISYSGGSYSGSIPEGSSVSISGRPAVAESVFSKHFRLGAGSAGGTAIAIFDAAMPTSLPAGFDVYSAAGGATGKKGIAELPAAQHKAAPARLPGQVVPSVALCTFLQMLLMALITSVGYVITLLPSLGWMWLVAAWGWRALGLVPLLSLVAMVAGVGWAVAGKWLAMGGRYKEGEYPLWGSYYLRHWAANQFVVSARNSYLALLKRTTLINWFWRAMGVRVGANVLIDTDDLLGADLIELKDSCVLDTFSGVTAVTFEAGRASSRFPTGTMTVKRASVGAGAVVGAHGMVVCSHVADGGVVQPCTASNNPASTWQGSRWPRSGPDAVTAVKTQERPLGALSGLLAIIITEEVLALLSYPLYMGFLMLWLRLASYSVDEVPVAVGHTLQCLVRTPGAPWPAESAARCDNLMQAAIKTMLILPTALFIVGQLTMLLVIPYKWLLVGRVKPSPEGLMLQPEAKSWGERFRSHLMQLMLDHPSLKLVLYMWTGTAVFNAWLRGMGAKVGRQAWIGEGLQLYEHDLVEIGDCVSVCSEVSMMPSTAMGSARISIQGGSDVTNQTCLYPGVTVRPGACLGVFTWAEPERTFPRNSIVQGPMVLMPGVAEPEEGGPPVAEDPAVTRRVSSWQYAKFNLMYAALMTLLLPLTLQLATLPFAVASTVLVFKTGLLWAALLVPFTWMLDLGMDVLWMALVKKALLPRCAGSNPFYHYTHTAWMITGILYYFHQIGIMKSLAGSQMAVWYYRLMGAKIGRGVLLNSLSSNEPDCLTIGDGAVLDDLCFVMCHTTENRQVKFHDVRIGARATIGCGSAVMPGCEICDEAVIGDVSIVMKGETVAPGCVWRGVPAVPVLEQA